MSNDKNNLKRGIYRMGIMVGILLSSIALLLGVANIFVDNLDFYFYFPLTLIMTAICFLVSVLLAKGLGWIVEGFQKSYQSKLNSTDSND